MVLIGKSLNERRAVQVERRAACAAAAAAGRASSASPVPPTPVSSLPSAGLSRFVPQQMQPVSSRQRGTLPIIRRVAGPKIKSQSDCCVISSWM